jgi:hypothetical protein
LGCDVNRKADTKAEPGTELRKMAKRGEFCDRPRVAPDPVTYAFVIGSRNRCWLTTMVAVSSAARDKIGV